MTQLVQLIEECRLCSMEWSAVATIVPSSELISSAMATTEKIAIRCEAGASGTSPAATASGPWRAFGSTVTLGEATGFAAVDIAENLSNGTTRKAAGNRTFSTR